jgi:hypothetical protein
LQNLTGAWPTSYYTYINKDFGTVQGFNLAYDLRAVKNLTLRAAYTLQFAKGTGSNSTSNLNILQSDQPSLRILTFLDYDQRHKFTVNFDYRFGGGKDYNGPETKKKTKEDKVKIIRWFENTGININFNAGSGMPYTKSSTVASLDNQGKLQMQGTLNGSRKPWTFDCTLRLDKSWFFKMNAKDKEGNTKGKTRMGGLTAYVDITNVFNLKNVLSVYEYTGNANDDGYLASDLFATNRNGIMGVDSYIDIYTIIMQNSYRYSLPIRAILGIQFTF